MICFISILKGSSGWSVKRAEEGPREKAVGGNNPAGFQVEAAEVGLGWRGEQGKMSPALCYTLCG